MMRMCRPCPMLNSQGVCDALLRRPEHIRRCPHRRMRLAIPEPSAKRNAEVRLTVQYMRELKLPAAFQRELENQLVREERLPDG